MPGVWDMQLIWFDCVIPQIGERALKPVIIPAIHWFEFKVGKDILSDKQEAFQARNERLGHKFYVVSRECEFMNNLETIIQPTLYIAKEIFKDEIVQKRGEIKWD